MPNSGRPLSAVLDELAERADGLIDTQRRLDGLLDTVISLGSDLSLPDVLSRVVKAACALSGAGYGALGVVGRPDGLSQFITVGMTDAAIGTVGDLPRGAGVLGVLLDHPSPLRLDDLSRHPASVGFPPHHPPMRSFLGVPIRVRGEVFGNLYLTEKAGGQPFDQQDEDMVVALASAAGVAIQNARFFGEAERQQQWLSATAEIAAALAWGTDESEALALVTDGAVACSGALDGVLLLLSPAEERTLLIAGVSGMPAAAHPDVERTWRTDRLFRALSADGPVQLTEAQGLPSWLVPPRGGSVMLLPLRGAQAASLGVLALRFEQRQVGREDVSLAGTFASQAAVALALGRARRDHERLAVLEDRERISQDLHDVVIQRLYATGLSLQNLPATDGGAGAELIERSIDEIDASIRDLRRAIFSLRPEVNRFGLRAAITEQVRTARGGLSFEPVLRFDGPVDLAVNAGLAADVQVVVREALANVMRHAHASEVLVWLSVADGEIVCQVSDNGSGIPDTIKGSGTVNLRMRAERRSGTFTLEVPPGGGTVLRWSAPLSS